MMNNHTIFVMLTVAYSISLFTLAVLFAAYLQNKKPLMFYFALLILILTVRQVAQTYIEYLFTNLRVPNSFLFIESNCITFSALFFALPIFVHELLEVRLKVLKNLILTGVAAFSLLLIEYYHLLVLPHFHLTGTLKDVCFPPVSFFPRFYPYFITYNVIKVTVFAYILLLFASSLKRQLDKSVKSFSLVSIVLLGLWVGVEFQSVLKTYPLSLIPGAGLFLIWNLYIIGYIAKNHMGRRNEEARQQLLTADSLERIAEYYNISEREKDVIQLIIQGKTNKEMAAELFISDATVKTHIANIYRKLGLNNRVELVGLIMDQSGRTQAP